METVLEFLAITVVAAVVYSATTSDSAPEIARRTVRFATSMIIGVSVLAAGIYLLS